MNAFIQQAELRSATERFINEEFDPFYVPSVQACVCEPNDRLIELLTAPRNLTALEWREVEILTGESE